MKYLLLILFFSLSFAYADLDRLSDPSARTVISAMSDLSANLDDPEVSKRLLPFLLDDRSEVATAAIRIFSSRAGEAEIQRLIILKVNHPHSMVRISAMRALAPYVSNRNVVNAIAARLSHPRARASEVIAAMEILSSELENPLVRRNTILQLGSSVNRVRESAVSILKEGLQKEPVSTIFFNMGSSERQVLQRLLGSGGASESRVARILLSHTRHSDESISAFLGRLRFRHFDEVDLNRLRTILSGVSALEHENALFHAVRRAALRHEGFRIELFTEALDGGEMQGKCMKLSKNNLLKIV